LGQEHDISLNYLGTDTIIKYLINDGTISFR